ncbi:polyprenyl synthetase family protein [Embleya sp. NPDC056575]|uniref:polyprenyl synthetase family protein n=1 Tax=unclassified Embleya TaxID=2699296 RepID=UPI003693CD01
MTYPPAAGERIDMTVVREQVDAVLEEFLAGKAREAAECGHPPEVVPVVRDFLAADGKRIRPVLCVVGWHAAGGRGERHAILRVAASLELFVTFALIHDDIMDDSATRRGRPTVHRLLAKRYADHRRPERMGADAALLVGNLALIWSRELLHSAGLDADRARAVHAVDDTLQAEVMFGQYRDLLGGDRFDEDVEAALAIVRYKTAGGTVQRPLQLGAAVAGAGPDLANVFTALGLPLGEAFQLRDDLLGVFGRPDSTGKPNLDDLREGKRTVLLALALRRADAEQQATLRALVGRADLDEDGARRIRVVLEATGARRGVEDMITARYRRALRVLDEAAFAPAPDAALRELALAATAREM